MAHPMFPPLAPRGRPMTDTVDTRAARAFEDMHGMSRFDPHFQTDWWKFNSDIAEARRDGWRHRMQPLRHPRFFAQFHPDADEHTPLQTLRTTMRWLDKAWYAAAPVAGLVYAARSLRNEPEERKVTPLTTDDKASPKFDTLPYPLTTDTSPRAQAFNHGETKRAAQQESSATAKYITCTRECAQQYPAEPSAAAKPRNALKDEL